MTSRYNPERRTWRGISYKKAYKRIAELKRRIRARFEMLINQD